MKKIEIQKKICNVQNISVYLTDWRFWFYGIQWVLNASKWQYCLNNILQKWNKIPVNIEFIPFIRVIIIALPKTIFKWTAICLFGKKVDHLKKISKIKLQTISIFHAKRLRNNAFELCFMEFEVTFLISYHYCVYLMHYRDNERGYSFQRKITSARIQRVAYIGGW